MDGEVSGVEPGQRKEWIRFEQNESGTCEPPTQVRGNNNVNGHGASSPEEFVATLEPSQTVQITANPLLSSSAAEEKGHSHVLQVDPLSSPAKLPPPPPVTSSPSRPSSFNNNSSTTTTKAIVHSQPSSPGSSSLVSGAQISSKITSPPNLHSIPLKDITSSSLNPSSPTSPKSFRNGDILVNLLPLNKHCAWVTPATFKPELVPEELMAQNLTLTVEDYVSALQILVNDLRFNLYIILYKRILVVWIALGFFVLLSLLFSGVKGLALFGGGILWLIINALGIFVSMWFKIKLNRMLEACMATVNSIFLKNNILLGVDDKGKISCHKVNLVFVYFDVSYCIKYLKDMIDNEDRVKESQGMNNPISFPSVNSVTRLDIGAEDIIITGSNPTRLPQKEKYAEKLLLRYSQRWVKEYVRKRLELHIPLHGDASVETNYTPLTPRHCETSRCPCQFIEEHLKYKPLMGGCSIKDLFI